MVTSHRKKKIPGPWPFYFLIPIGIVLTGFAAWALVLFETWHRKKKSLALGLLIVNVWLFIIIALVNAKLAKPWWHILMGIHTFDIVWAALAALFQYLVIGKVKPRFIWSEKKYWIYPILMGLLIGYTLSLFHSIPTLFDDRINLKNTMDSLDRLPFFYDLLKNGMWGIPFGLLLGLYWARNGKLFSTRHIVSFLIAVVFTAIATTLISGLIGLIYQKLSATDPLIYSTSQWSALSFHLSDFKRGLLKIQSSTALYYLIVPLMISSVRRMRDFLKRSLIIPLLFIVSLFYLPTYHIWWETIQGEMLNQLTSHESNVQDKALKRAALFLERYPNHQSWPVIAEKAASISYQKNKFDNARRYYSLIIERYQNENQFQSIVQNTKGILNAPYFGKPVTSMNIDIPIIEKESYLTHNWMSLLSAIRYWEKEKGSESDLKFRLKSLSIDDDAIHLYPLTQFAELDDAAHQMGYEVLILPANFEHLKKLLSAKIPVIHQHHEAFRIMFGFNEGRKIFFYYGFETLLFEGNDHKKKQVNEIVSMKRPDQKEPVSLNKDILEQSRKMISYDLWNAPRTKYSGPLMAVVYPFSKEKHIVDTLKRPMSELKEASDSILAALIGLSFFNHADIIKGIKWAQKSRGIIHTSFADHIAYLNYSLWKSRNKVIKSTLLIQKQFPHLNSIDTFLDEAKTSAYLKKATTQFKQDLKENKLNRWVINAYLSLLDISVESEAEERATLYLNHLSFIPEDSMGWYHLYRHHHYKGNIPEKINALKGLISAKPHDYNARLSLALNYLLINDMKKVQEIFNAIPYNNMRYNADYWFLKGVLEEKKGRKRRALKLYAKAIDMRKYLPIYHLHYGRLLLKTGKVQEGIKVLKWAGLIDATGEIKEVADALLENV